jgi:hypothetical protein
MEHETSLAGYLSELSLCVAYNAGNVSLIYEAPAESDGDLYGLNITLTYPVVANEWHFVEVTLQPTGAADATSENTFQASMVVDTVAVTPAEPVYVTAPPADGHFFVGGVACSQREECDECGAPKKEHFFSGYIDEVYVVKASNPDHDFFFPALADETYGADAYMYLNFHTTTDSKTMYTVTSDSVTNKADDNAVMMVTGDVSFEYVAVPWQPSTLCAVESYFSHTPYVAMGMDLVTGFGYNFAKSQWSQCLFVTQELQAMEADGDVFMYTAHATASEEQLMPSVWPEGVVMGGTEIDCLTAPAGMPSVARMQPVNPRAVNLTQDIKYRESALELEGDGKMVDETVCGTATMGHTLELSCPAGLRLDHVYFASYGTPKNPCTCQGSPDSNCDPDLMPACDGSNETIGCLCDAFEVDAHCDADTGKAPYYTMDVIEKHCLGKPSCTVPATNEAFGEPCAGAKHLSVSMRCSDRWQAKDFVDCSSVLPLMGEADDATEKTAFSFGSWIYPHSKLGVQSVVAFGAQDEKMNRAILQWHGKGSTGMFYYYDDCVNDVFPKQPFRYLADDIELATNQWYYVYLTVDAENEGYLYVDGFQVAHFSTGSRPAVDGTCYIGMDLDDNGIPKEFFAGLVDEVRFYNKAVSVEEMRAGAYWTISAETEGLVAYYQFNYGQKIRGAEVIDSAGGTTSVLASSSATVWNNETLAFDTVVAQIHPAHVPVGAPWYPTMTLGVTDTSTSTKAYAEAEGPLAGGGTIVVDGLNFAAPHTRLFYDGEMIPFSYVSDVSLTATVPTVAAPETSVVDVTNGPYLHPEYQGSLKEAMYKRSLLDTDLSLGLFAFYPLYADAADYGPGGYNGEVTGATAVENRNHLPAQAMLFDSDDDVITLPASAAAQGDYTVAVWVWYSDVEPATYATCAGYDASPFVEEGSVMTGAWKFVVLTMEGDVHTVYVNDEMVEGDTKYADMPLHIAAGAIGGSGFMGAIDDVWIYTRVLSELEITQLYFTHQFALEFGSGATVTIPRGDTPLGASGLLASYHCASGESVTELVSTVNKDWGKKDPCAGEADGWTAEFTGFVYAPTADTYTFYVMADDSVKLTVGDDIVIDRAYVGHSMESMATVSLAEGWYAVGLHYFDAAGKAEVSLSWSSSTEEKALVPATHLKAGTGPFTATAWVYPYTLEGAELTQTILSKPMDGGFAGLNFGISGGGLYAAVYHGTCLADEQPNMKCSNYREVFSWKSKVTCDKWQHVAVMYLGDAFYFFVDGLLTDFVEYDSMKLFAESEEPLYVGRGMAADAESVVLGAPSDERLFNGLIHSVALYDHANFTQADMQAMVMCPVHGLQEGLVAYLLLDEGVGFRAHDFAVGGVYGEAELHAAPLVPALEFWTNSTCGTYGAAFEMSHLTGTDLEETVAGETSHFTVELYDACGYKRRTGGDDVRVAIVGPLHTTQEDCYAWDGTQCTIGVEDQGDGSYAVEFHLTMAGFYKVHTMMYDDAGEPVGEPFEHITYVNPDVMHVPSSYIYHTVSDRLDLDELWIGHAGREQIYKVQVVDQFNNLRTAGGDTVDVYFAGPTNLTAKIVDNTDGTYTVSYVPQVAGKYTMNVQMCDTPVCLWSDSAPSVVLPPPAPPILALATMKNAAKCDT